LQQDEPFGISPRQTMKKRPVIYHPLFFALFPVLSLYASNIHQVQAHEVIVTAVILLAISSIIWFILWRVLNEDRKSAVISSVFLLFLFSFGHTLTITAVLLMQLNLIDKGGYLYLMGTSGMMLWFLIFCLLFGLVVYFIVKSKNDLRQTTLMLNFLSLILVLSTIARGMLSFTQSRYSGTSQQSHSSDSLAATWDDPIQEESFAGDQQQSLADIYYIVLDGYARQDMLSEIYDLNNAEFVDQLVNRGFYVAGESYANYCQTMLSLSSSLNYEYLDSLIEHIGSQADNTSILTPIVEHSRVIQKLRATGYEIVAFASGYSPSEINNADEYLAPTWSPTSFHHELINTTPLTLLRTTQYNLHRERIMFTLANLPDVAKMEQATFTFVHLLAPHPPFVFNAKGEPVQPDRQFTIFDGSDYTDIAGRQEYIDNYREQLIYISEQVILTVDQILSNSPEPPIIILQGDHGPGAMLDWNDIENTYLPERMAILNAYYFPDQDYGSLYPHITPVNTFRVIFNQYFQVDINTLDDQIYFSTLEKPFLLIDVTDRVDIMLK
jgi:hypothetical protein